MKNIKTIEELKTELITINSKIAEIEKQQKAIYDLRNRKLNEVRCKINPDYKNLDFEKMGAIPFPKENSPRRKLVFEYPCGLIYYIEMELMRYYLNENIDQSYPLEKIPISDTEFQNLIAQLNIKLDAYQYVFLNTNIKIATNILNQLKTELNKLG